jgi:hypothetical protein
MRRYIPNEAQVSATQRSISHGCIHPTKASFMPAP